MEITLDNVDGIDQFESISQEFMKSIFGLSHEDYLITDKSNLRDFVPIFGPGSDMQQVVGEIMDRYKIGFVPSNLFELFRQIELCTREQ